MSEITKEDVIDYILTCDHNELNDIKDCVRDRSKTLSSKLKYSLQVGQHVKITGTGKFEEGIVEKVNKTRAVVKVDINGTNYSYNVPFSMIKP
tara:strand:+ start:3567 stop:3845 length:279 start_codon:yes stop_codon:yes gene_type:complete